MGLGSNFFKYNIPKIKTTRLAVITGVAHIPNSNGSIWVSVSKIRVGKRAGKITAKVLMIAVVRAKM